MNDAMTNIGGTSRAEAVRIRFAKHYAIMRKYHTQVKNYEEAVAAREEAEHQYFDPLIAAIDDEFGE